jgi:hypothetical protein
VAASNKAVRSFALPDAFPALRALAMRFPNSLEIGGTLRGIGTFPT